MASKRGWSLRPEVERLTAACAERIAELEAVLGRIADDECDEYFRQPCQCRTCIARAALGVEK